jgi:hypothetical protein
MTTLTEAIAETAKLSGVSIGAAKMKIIEACHAGDIRTCWYGYYRGGSPAIARHEWAGADIDYENEVLIPANNGQRKRGVSLNTSDYEAWRTLQTTTTVLPEPATSTARAAAQNKRTRAKQAITALWPAGAPPAAALPPGVLCAKVSDWLKADCETHHLPRLDISDDTILRAAGRK